MLVCDLSSLETCIKLLERHLIFLFEGANLFGKLLQLVVNGISGDNPHGTIE